MRGVCVFVFVFVWVFVLFYDVFSHVFSPYFSGVVLFLVSVVSSCFLKYLFYSYIYFLF